MSIFSEERKKEIADLVNEREEVLKQELTKLFNVSGVNNKKRFKTVS